MSKVRVLLSRLSGDSSAGRATLLMFSDFDILRHFKLVIIRCRCIGLLHMGLILDLVRISSTYYTNISDAVLLVTSIGLQMYIFTG